MVRSGVKVTAGTEYAVPAAAETAASTAALVGEKVVATLAALPAVTMALAAVEDVVVVVVVASVWPATRRLRRREVVAESAQVQVEVLAVWDTVKRVVHTPLEKVLCWLLVRFEKATPNV